MWEFEKMKGPANMVLRSQAQVAFLRLVAIKRCRIRVFGEGKRTRDIRWRCLLVRI